MMSRVIPCPTKKPLRRPIYQGHATAFGAPINPVTMVSAASADNAPSPNVPNRTPQATARIFPIHMLLMIVSSRSRRASSVAMGNPITHRLECCREVAAWPSGDAGTARHQQIAGERHDRLVLLIVCGRAHADHAAVGPRLGRPHFENLAFGMQFVAGPNRARPAQFVEADAENAARRLEFA